VVFEPTALEGVWLLGLDRHEDQRGFFARIWSGDEFRERGLDAHLEQCSLSFNHRAGTVRGMHFQAPPREEVKVVRCIRGAIHDVVLDLRPHSPTFKRWVARELSAENRLAFYVPKGCAHGFQTLTDDAEVLYLISEPYDPTLGRGVRWNDPAFAISWPLPASVMSDRDQAYPDFLA
jgi:dTDP-4-dehydrorhamnose 3,5-epimerase